MFEELIDEVRRSQSATDRFDQAVAEALRLNRTDMRCLDVLQRVGGPIAAGQLAEATGLTTGAMTAAIDRLERSGYARRLRDDSDRRRVLVELTPKAGNVSADFYSEHIAQAQRLYKRYSEAELELLLGFVREGREFNELHAARVEAQNRSRTPAKRPRDARPQGELPTESAPADSTHSAESSHQ
ncbi:MAG TPA: MarR family transcriptional regulator [Solirubrobacteraceae bacterium]|nr:MarR family transcriptional regulator [Solirubrobacteraceae bacterium]